jgi:glycosyltransferase involved in cell wall biosynthesis
VPSEYREPKGFFLLEAMACGTPVVQPAHGSYPELIGKTKGGLLTEPGCRVDLADKLDSLARDREALTRLSKNAAEGVRRHFALPAVAERTAHVYRSVCQGALPVA